MSWPARLVLLQVSFIRQGDARSAITAVGIILGLLLVLVITASLTGAGRRRTRRSARYTRNAFRRAAVAHGLPRTHVEALEALVAATRVGQPMLLFTSSGLLDDTLRKGIYSLRGNAQIPEADRQQKLTVLFQIRQLIEKNSKRGVVVASTSMLRPGQELGLTFPDGSSIQSRVTHNLRRMIACEVPPDLDRNKWRKGTPLRAMLWRHQDSGYEFQTKILAYDTIAGRLVFLLQHTRAMRRSQRRAHRRKAIGRNCFFYPVLILETGHGRGARREAVVQQSFRHLGVMQDISAGGCAIASQSPLARGKLLRIDFELGNRRRITAYGKVQRVGAPEGGRSTMHIMFTRVSTLQLNEILSFVYDYDANPPGQSRVPATRRR